MTPAAEWQCLVPRRACPAGLVRIPAPSRSATAHDLVGRRRVRPARPAARPAPRRSAPPRRRAGPRRAGAPAAVATGLVAITPCSCASGPGRAAVCTSCGRITHARASVSPWRCETPGRAASGPARASYAACTHCARDVVEEPLQVDLLLVLRCPSAVRLLLAHDARRPAALSSFASGLRPRGSIAVTPGMTRRCHPPIRSPRLYSCST